MSKLTFKQFLDEQQRKEKDNSKIPQNKQAKALPPTPKKIAVKPQIKSIATTDVKREPTAAEMALKAALKQSKRQGHLHTLADILGIYPT